MSAHVCVLSHHDAQTMNAPHPSSNSGSLVLAAARGHGACAYIGLDEDAWVLHKSVNHPNHTLKNVGVLCILIRL